MLFLLLSLAAGSSLRRPQELQVSSRLAIWSAQSSALAPYPVLRLKLLLAWEICLGFLVWDQVSSQACWLLDFPPKSSPNSPGLPLLVHWQVSLINAWIIVEVLQFFF